MTLWSEFTAEEITALKTAVVSTCTSAAGSLSADKQLALGTLFDTAVTSYANAGVRSWYDPDDGIPGIIAAGRPYLPDIVAILRNSDASFVPAYGRTTSSESLNKTGTEQVSIKPSASSTLDEKITVKVPDLRSASTGNITASDVDAAEKIRFDAETEKSLYLLLSKWVRRASVYADL